MVREQPEYWYRDDAVSRVLAPLSWLYCGVMRMRRLGYRLRLLPSGKAGVPVIVVGNLTVGGSGKTPLTVWVVEQLVREGWRPGIVSRGYGGRASQWPQQVRPDSDSVVVGDEAVLIARRTGRPMSVGPNRLETARALVRHADVDIIVTDDGLQHYRLQRDIEIAVVDGRRRYGNGRCLPAGPLREPLSRGRAVDFTICNGTPMEGECGMRLVPGEAINLVSGEQRSLESLNDGPVHAVAGIGDPERFFVSLRRRGLRIISHPFQDHHEYAPGDMEFMDERPVLMTEKDAMKYGRYATRRHWFLPVTAEVDDELTTALSQRLEGLRNG
ncbi:MAG: tetraacyldisaccharide 4'-kinase [Pseudomonadota bacterium]